jgi:formylglycine-generating enzyme required for sulfatase activity
VFCVKVFQPSALLLDKPRAKTEIELFLNSARVQQKVASGSAGHWAPIHQCESTAQGAFCVTNRYDRSLQQLIDGHVKLSSLALYTIVQSVAEALVELKQACGRAHGNLKPNNILIADAEDVRQTQTVLSDPLPDEYVDAKAHWDTDLRAIGKFIYQLVVHRPSPAVDGWQVPDTKEWSRLGKQANAWRNLCNRLLNAHLRPGAITLELLAEELARLKEARPALPPRYLIAAGAVVAACIVALVMLLRAGPPPEKAEWENLCTEYTAWVEALYKDLGLPKGNQTAQAWQNDADLKQIIERIKSASYPYTVVVSRGQVDVSDIVAHPEYAEQKETQRALKAIEDIKSFFDPNSDNPWTVIRNLQTAADAFAQRDWQGPAAHLQSLAGGVKPQENSSVLQSVEKILEFHRKGILDRIIASAEEIRKYQEIVAGSGDPVLAKFDYDYVNRQTASVSRDAGEQNIDRLNERLRQMAELGRQLAEFVEGDWQTKVDRNAFLEDHRNDIAEIPGHDTFDKRLAAIREYYYLHPDPRDELFRSVLEIEKYMPLARVSNPVEAGGCAEDLEQLRPDLEIIRNKKGIDKNRLDITDAVSDYTPKLNKLLERVIAAAETAADYRKRAKEEPSTARDEAIREKWRMLRGDLLDKHPLAMIEQDLKLYSELRQKIDDTNDSLTKLDEELQRELPLQTGMALKEKGWNRKLKEACDQERKETIRGIVENIPLHGGVPDIDDQSFVRSRLTKFSRFKQWRTDLGEILAAFEKIEYGLEGCYLLDEELAEKGGTIRLLWNERKDADILKETRINSAVAELVSRVQTLEAIDNETDAKKLVDTARQSGFETEALYAAWMGLGNLSWPNEYEDLRNDRSIRDRLKTKFENIIRENGKRGLFLLEMLIGTGLKREMDFVEKNRAGDKVLDQLVKFAGELNCLEVFDECQKLEAGAKDLADFVAGQDWQSGKIRKEPFFADSKVHKLQGPVSAETLQNWLAEVGDYRQLDADPRAGYLWDAKIEGINQLISKGLEQESGLTEETAAKLEQNRSSLATLVGEVKKMQALPAIKKNESQISSDRCSSFWARLEELEGEIRSIIKPVYCNRIEIDNGRLIFASEYLRVNFEPVLGLNGPEVPSDESLEGGAGIVGKSKRLATDVVEGGKKIGEEVSERLTGLLGRKKNITDTEPTRPVLGWEQIRQAVQNKQREWLDFFFTIDGNDAQNVGWPRYMRSLKNGGVMFSFVPAGPGNPEPLYMAMREITNLQYRIFLTATGAKTATTLSGWSWFKDQAGNELIRSTRRDYPPAGIKWNKSLHTFYVADEDADLPVTWVTYYGAQSYAKWLAAQLPTASEYAHAAKAGTNNIYPWGNDVSQIAVYAHTRAFAWQHAASEYNSKVGALETPPPPVGAVRKEGFVPYETRIEVGPRELVYNRTAYSSVWPISHADKPNGWGLYDMVGNVWEWCRTSQDGEQPVICGGSCLSPPEYARADSKYPFDGRACDVGFRAVAPAR